MNTDDTDGASVDCGVGGNEQKEAKGAKKILRAGLAVNEHKYSMGTKGSKGNEGGTVWHAEAREDTGSGAVALPFSSC